MVRFPTHKAGGLLAYLAYYVDRSHPREELIDRFWPDAAIEAGRVNLRSALAALRRQLESLDVAAERVLIADRSTVRLDSEAIRTDVALFLQEVQSAARAPSPLRQIEAWERAVSIYRGELLPGYYDDWVTIERGRLAEVYRRMLLQLSVALEQQGDYARAITCVRNAVQADPLDEAAHCALIRHCAASGQMTAALRQYQEWERILREELNATPEQSFEEIVRAARGGTAGQSPIRASIAGGVIETATGAVSMRPPPESDSSLPQSPPTPPAFHPLPMPLTPFFGREQEVDQVLSLLETPGTRLVTLTGMGGTGKTRLSLEIASHYQQAGRGQVCFVALADLADPNRIGEAVRAALGGAVSASVFDESLDLITARLHGRPTLLILDNFEQLIADGTGQAYVARLLERLPLLQCLVTSRLPLGISSEWEFPVLPLPTPTAPATLERLMEFASIRLFVNCAQAVRPDFQITAANAQTVAQLCHSLEGVPLALELASARAQVMTPTQMLTQLAYRLDLASRHRDVVERHRTLRATMDWSYHLLSPELQQFFACLSVFRGSWTIDAAEALCEPGAEEDSLSSLQPFCLLPSSSCLGLLEQLREHSLIIAQERGQEMRFRMLEVVRQYSEEKLAASGQSDAVRARCIAFFRGFVADAGPHLSGPQQAQWLDRIDTEHDNLRMILDSCQTGAQIETALVLVGTLCKFWTVRGHIVEGLQRTEALLTHPGAAAHILARAAALYGAGYLAWYRSDYEAARKYVEESLTIRREYGDARGAAEALHRLGAMALFLDDNTNAQILLDQSRALWEEVGDELGLARTLARLSELRRKQGQIAAARSLQMESLTLLQRVGAIWESGYSLWCLGHIAFDEQDYTVASAYYRQALAAVRATGDISNLPLYLESLGHVAHAEGQEERVVRLFAAAAGLRVMYAIRPLPEAAARAERCLAAVRSAWGEEPFAAVWTAGSELSVEGAVAYALQGEHADPAISTLVY
jgi:predicted ATPase/DNA-binding SARP family transcriptional activator